MNAASQITVILKSNIFQISAAVFFISIIIIAVSMMLNKKNEDREKLIKQIMALVIAAFIVISAASISGTLNNIIGNMTVTANGNSGQESDIIKIDDQEDKGFWQKGIDAIFGYIADAAEIAKKYLIGTSEDVGIRAILHKAVANPLADYNVPTKRGGTVNLYTIILNGTSFLTFLMVINTAYKLMKFSWNPSKREEVINALSKWAYIIIIIAASPALFAAATEIMDIIMNIFNEINLDYTIDTNIGTNLSEYGIVWAVLRIVMAYVEFRIFILMIYRTFVINAYYITSPVAIYLWGISDNFFAANGWLNGILINVFSPIAYEITFILAVIIIKTFYSGNLIAPVIIMLFGLTIGDVIKGIVNYKISGNVLGGMQDVKNMTRGVFGTMMTVITLSRLGKGIANSKIFQTSSTDNKVPSASGSTSSGNERSSFESSNTTNTQNKSENKAEQLGRANISNNENVSPNQSSTIKNNSFSHSNANQLGETNISNRSDNIRQPDNINLQNNTRPSDINNGQVINTDSISRENTSNIGGIRQPDMKNQNRDSDVINSFGFESSGYFRSSTPNASNNQSEVLKTNISEAPHETFKNNDNQKASQIKEDISTVKKGIHTVANVAPMAAGIGATIATGNPILGYAASKGTQLALNATENIIKGSTNTVKQTVEAAKAATNLTKNTVQRINKAVKSNSDFKAYRRD